MSSVANQESLVLDGALTLRHIATIRTKLAAALEHQSAIAIDCAAATEIDLSFIQLLLAARKSAARAGKTFLLARPASGALRESLTRAGILPSTEGGGLTDEASFWLKGADPT